MIFESAFFFTIVYAAQKLSKQSNPYVVLKLEEQSKKTNKQKKTASPQWEEEFSL